MHALDIFTILCTGLMIGNELTVSLFINPVLWKLEQQAQARALRLFASLLGKAMPFWYILSLVLMLVEAYLRRHEPALTPLLIASGLWIAIILYSISTLVPINNRIAALNDSIPEAEWKNQARKWDTLHRWRILLLIVAIVFLLHGLLPR